MLLPLLLGAGLTVAGQAKPHLKGAVAKACDEGECGYLVVRGGEVRYILVFANGEVGQDRQIGRYLKAAQTQAPKTEPPILELTAANGWRVIISAYLEGSLLALHARMINSSGKVMDILRTDTSVLYARAGPLFGGKDQIFAISAMGHHPYTSSWWAFLLPDSGYPRLIGQGNGYITAVRSGKIEPGIRVQRQHTVDNDSNRVLTITEFWSWRPKIPMLILTQH